MSNRVFCLILILCFLFRSANSSETYTNCSPEALRNLKSLTEKYTHVLCGEELELNQRRDCWATIARLQDQNLKCISSQMSPPELRLHALAFVVSPQFRPWLEIQFLNTGEEQEIRRALFDEFQILVLPGGRKIMQLSAFDQTRKWSREDLLLLQEGYRKLREAVEAKIRLAHQAGKADRALIHNLKAIWGWGGAVAQIGQPIAGIGRQFGEHLSDNPMMYNVVVSLGEAHMEAATIAQRIAHENGHSLDILRGGITAGLNWSWSESKEAQIFRACGVKKPDYLTPLQDCYVQNPTWFSFHPSSSPSNNYAAKRSAEFYTKMLDEWVREGLGLKRDGQYRCQNPWTEIFWKEMETQLLGQVISRACER